MYGEGISRGGRHSGLSAVDAKLVEKAGSWYSYAGKPNRSGPGKRKELSEGSPGSHGSAWKGSSWIHIKNDDIAGRTGQFQKPDISEIMDLLVDEDGVIIEEAVSVQKCYINI